MKRFTPLALVVLALGVVPQALADDGTTPAQPVDTRVQSVVQRLQDWLDGKGGSPTDGENALDQAAQDLGRLSGSNG
jgi:hypothetical protein